MRGLGCTALEKTARVLENMADGGEQGPLVMNLRLSPGRQKKLAGWCHAILTNRIGLHEKRNHLFPVNLSRIFFIHVETERLGGQPRILGWQVWEPVTRQVVESRVWTMESEGERCRVRPLFTPLAMCLDANSL